MFMSTLQYLINPEVFGYTKYTFCIQNTLVLCTLVKLCLFFSINSLDHKDGWLEALLSSSSAYVIVISKFCALSLLSLFFSFIQTILSFIFYNDVEQICSLCDSSQLSMLYFGTTIFSVSIFIDSLIVLFSSMVKFFQKTGYILSALILPVVLPINIVASIVLQNNPSMFLMLCGVNCIVIPISILLSSHLVQHSYNIV